MSLGNGLGILKDRVFRIGHLGDFNDLSLIGALSGVEMGLKLAGIPHASGGVDAAMAVLTAAPPRANDAYGPGGDRAGGADAGEGVAVRRTAGAPTRECRPRDGVEATAIQAAVLAEFGETVAGWKISMSQQTGLMIGLFAALAGLCDRRDHRRRAASQCWASRRNSPSASIGACRRAKTHTSAARSRRPHRFSGD